MEKMLKLKDLLKHELEDLYSAEEQIIDALPAMVEKSKNPTLKKALSEHLKVTKKQKTRLDEALKQLGSESDTHENKKKGFFSTLFGASGGSKCKGMEGLIDEGEKMMEQDMTQQVMDAAIIASAQKIEHYEICGYGTARAYARELQLPDLVKLLETTLNEEYEADDLLTELAVGRINEDADPGFENRTNGHSTKTRIGSKSNNGAGSKVNNEASRTNGKASSNGASRSNVTSTKNKNQKSKTTNKQKSTASKSSRSRNKKSSK